MSVNTAHANNGVLIHAGEYILLHSDNVSMEFSGQDNPVFSGSKGGRIYLTSHRMIFNNKKPGDDMQSFSAPFIAMNDVELEQPVFGSNYIKGKVRAQPNGNFIGEVKFKLYFKSGGAIEYGMALLRAAKTAQSNYHSGGRHGDDPPPYTPSGNWHEAPPPAYQPPPGYYGWLPQHDAFSGPAPNTVYMSDNPPPYPGIGGPPPYSAQPQLYPQVPPCNPQQYNPGNVYDPNQQQPYNPNQHQPYNPNQQQPYNPNQQQPYNPNQQQPYNPYQQGPPQPQSQHFHNPPAGGDGAGWNGFALPQADRAQQQPQQHNAANNQSQKREEPPSWNGFSLPPDDEAEPSRQQQTQQSSAPPPQGGPGTGAAWGGGYQPGPSNAGAMPPYPPYPNYPPTTGYPPYPPQQPQPYGSGGYPPYPPVVRGPPPAGAMGFTAPPSYSKEAEALRSAYNTTANQQSNRPGPSDMPPSYEDLPPTYNPKKYQ